MQAFLPDEHHLILAGVIAICIRIIWDWLAAPRKLRQAERVENHIDHVERMNGHMEADLAEIKTIVKELEARQVKMWDLMNSGKKR